MIGRNVVFSHRDHRLSESARKQGRPVHDAENAANGKRFAQVSNGKHWFGSRRMIHDKGWEIACRPWEDATVAERTEWTAILAANPSLYSPFLQPAFLDAAVAAGRNVETAVMRHAGGSRGFWAFERRGRWDAHPVAEGFSEGQAVVIASDAPRWNMADVLRACGLRRWRFDHAPVEQTELRRFATRVGPSPYADLSDGWDAFLLRQRAAGVKSLHESLRKLRKLQKEHGSVAFQANAGDNAFECLLRWKSDQHSRTGVPDVFENRDVVRLLDEVRRQRDSHFAGELAALSVDGQPIAVHLGVRTGADAHLWYPAYDPKWSRYSPGIGLLLKQAAHLCDVGVRRWHLGPGPQRYKQSLRSGEVQVAIGQASTSAFGSWAHRSVHWMRNHGRTVRAWLGRLSPANSTT